MRRSDIFCKPDDPRYRLWDPDPLKIKMKDLMGWLEKHRPGEKRDGKLIEEYFHPDQKNQLWNAFKRKRDRSTESVKDGYTILQKMIKTLGND